MPRTTDLTQMHYRVLVDRLTDAQMVLAELNNSSTADGAERSAARAERDRLRDEVTRRLAAVPVPRPDSVVAQTLRAAANEAEKNTRALWLAEGHRLSASWLQRITHATGNYVHQLRSTADFIEKGEPS